MSVHTIAIPAHYKNITMKQQTVSATSTALTPPALGDAVYKRPDNIFVQALAANSGKVYLGIGTTVAGAAGIELAPGANVNLPSNDPLVWQVIGTASDKLNITYQSNPS